MRAASSASDFMRQGVVEEVHILHYKRSAQVGKDWQGLSGVYRRILKAYEIASGSVVTLPGGASHMPGPQRP